MAEKLKVLVPVADGSEDIETACITDVLVRAGADVTVASVMPEKLTVTLARGLVLTAKCSIEDCKEKEWDAIALPGGLPGAEHLRDSATLAEMLKKQSSASKVTAAVCASPAVVFGTHGLLPGKATCYPAQKFKDVVGGWTDEKAVADGHVITSQGPGTSLQFALKIVEKLYGLEKAEELAKALLTTLN
mmetsp:Transcript_7815/g.17160  ORF Transcript_7815/g.17160 Transcript_7815/m.17160 type:complete len:189 (+) Transcript_7815:91-657(+)